MNRTILAASLVLATALSTLVDTVARSREIADRARMNGKLIVGDA